jgi:hypothetical protein
MALDAIARPSHKEQTLEGDAMLRPDPIRLARMVNEIDKLDAAVATRPTRSGLPDGEQIGRLSTERDDD